MKIDELFERERHIRAAMTNRAGLMSLLLHQTVDHEALQKRSTPARPDPRSQPLKIAFYSPPNLEPAKVEQTGKTEALKPEAVETSAVKTEPEVGKPELDIQRADVVEGEQSGIPDMELAVKPIPETSYTDNIPLTVQSIPTTRSLLRFVSSPSKVQSTAQPVTLPVTVQTLAHPTTQPVTVQTVTLSSAQPVTPKAAPQSLTLPTTLKSTAQNTIQPITLKTVQRIVTPTNVTPKANTRMTFNAKPIATTITADGTTKRSIVRSHSLVATTTSSKPPGFVIPATGVPRTMPANKVLIAPAKSLGQSVLPKPTIITSPVTAGRTLLPATKKLITAPNQHSIVQGSKTLVRSDASTVTVVTVKGAQADKSKPPVNIAPSPANEHDYFSKHM